MSREGGCSRGICDTAVDAFISSEWRQAGVTHSDLLYLDFCWKLLAIWGCVRRRGFPSVSPSRKYPAQRCVSQMTPDSHFIDYEMCFHRFSSFQIISGNLKRWTRQRYTIPAPMPFACPLASVLSLGSQERLVWRRSLTRLISMREPIAPSHPYLSEWISQYPAHLPHL